MAAREQEKSSPRAKKGRDSGRAKPLSLDALREYGALDGFSPPTEDFDPKGPWRNSYRIWLAGSQGRNDMGFIELKRSPNSDRKSFTLDVMTKILQSARSIHRIQATLQCADDALAAPRSWRLTSDMLDPQGQAIESAAWTESAQAQKGEIRVETKSGRLTRKVPASFTGDWPLFEAVQRLQGAAARPLEFALLEGLDVLKGGQRLSFRQNTALHLGDAGLNLVEYQQLGEGILPFHYWVDERHRLLFAITGLRAYIFDPEAQERFEKQLSSPSKGKKS